MPDKISSGDVRYKKLEGVTLSVGNFLNQILTLEDNTENHDKIINFCKNMVNGFSSLIKEFSLIKKLW